jgi:hypothetical protein
MLRWLGVQHQDMDDNDLFNHSEMLPLLLELAEDADSDVRRTVLGAFVQFEKLRDRSALPVLRRRLDDANALCRIVGAEALPILRKGLEDPEISVRRNAIHSMGTLGPGAREAVPALERRLQDGCEGERWRLGASMEAHKSKKLFPWTMSPPKWAVAATTTVTVHRAMRKKVLRRPRRLSLSESTAIAAAPIPPMVPSQRWTARMLVDALPNPPRSAWSQPSAAAAVVLAAPTIRQKRTVGDGIHEPRHAAMASASAAAARSAMGK